MRTTSIFFSIGLLFISLSANCQILTAGGGDVITDIVYEEPIPDPGYYILDCDNDSLGALPFPDLGTGYYMGFQGGLFPGGSANDPNPHQQNGKNISKAIKPLNSLGLVDYVNGEVTLVGIGPSLASDAYNEWKETQNDLGWPGTNHCLNVKGNFIGGKSVVDMLDIDGPYWASFLTGLASKNIQPGQVQVAWMLLMSSTDTMDVNFYVDTVSEQYIQILHNLMTICPNLQEVFISGTHYTGYTAPEHKRYNYIIEPYGYWSNLVVKNVITLQINNDPRLVYSGLGKNAPFITWGPYFWADGVTPRGTDGLSWPCDNFRDDTIGGGFHLKDEYKYKEGDLLDAFFNNNAIAKIWYKNAAAWSACGAGRMTGDDDAGAPEEPLTVYPSPASERISVPVINGLTGTTALTIYNSAGIAVYHEYFDAKTELVRTLNIHALPPGIYLVQMNDSENRYSGRFVKQ